MTALIDSPRRFAGFVAAALVVAALSACNNKPVPPCPSVRVDDATAKLTRFGDGPSRDLSNVAYQVRMVGYDGQCVFKDNGVEVVMDLVIELATGPAAKAGPATFQYFIAIPQYFPKPEGKHVFDVTRNLPGGAASRTRIEEKKVRVFLPLKKEEPAATYDVYVGLQLTAEDVAFNRNQASAAKR